MAKKLLSFFKKLLIFFSILVAIFGGLYVTCKYVLKDMTLITEFHTLGKNVGLYLFGKQDDVYVELKSENYENEVEKARKYYYLQLDNNAKMIYVVLENNIENFKNGVYEVKLPTELCKELENIKGQEIIEQAFQSAWDAFSNDKPELFYFDVNKFCLITKSIKCLGTTRYELSICKGANQTYFIDTFTSKEDVELAIQEYENIKQEILGMVNIENEEFTYSYQKILKSHDWIIDNVSYDSKMQEVNNSNIYGTLIKKEAICSGYAKAFKYMMDELKVPCIIVSGIGKDSSTGKEEKHAWNYVCIGEKWYAIDVTWDDPVINSRIGRKVELNDSIKYRYFLKGADTMQKDHIIINDTIEKIKIFQYPELSVQDFKKK